MSTLSTRTKITLGFYHQKYKEQVVEDYYLTKEQASFTSLPREAIKTCEKQSDRFPVIIFEDDRPAGFFILQGWNGVKDYYNNKRAMMVRAFSIHAAFQGQGIAHECLQLLPSFIKKHFPDKNEIVLGVNYMNTIAQHVYKKCGFTDRGIRTMGKRGKLHIMHLPI
ncbi:GNAT family N-acetyltransferase [Peribacillus deserti]|uniref:GNAT family N-acetyltransferase n=1 Tax=Peribacillus deserti TaxID=673318 RepID=A0A2N5M806_9BACI|nr:GNAT family N-acetyltransferase [Peribacillus deserti]PLT30491.1 GNAT family N-acetyltransferase [Peribacillus deserti]